MIKVTKTTAETASQEDESVYDQIWTIQEAINKAIAENRVVRFLSSKTNKQLKAEIDDLKGCFVRKPDKESKEVAIIPPGIEDFSFDNVDTSIATWTPPGGKTPGGIIIP